MYSTSRVTVWLSSTFSISVVFCRERGLRQEELACQSMLIWILHSVGLDCVSKCSSQPALPTELPLKSSQVGQDGIICP